MRLTRLTILCALGLIAGALHAAPTPGTLTALGEVRALSDKVKGFKANLEIRDKQGTEEQVATSTLLVSKEHGWRIQSSSNGSQYEFISDFTNFYQYFPKEKIVYKSVADSPEAQALFRRPVSDLNPLTLLDPATLQLKGKVQLAGEPVYHFEGTTSSQYLPQGKPVVRKMEAWISAKDGLPRKTVEQVDSGAIGTTIYRDVELNPSVKPEDFQFIPPPNVQVLDTKEQMERMQQPEVRKLEAPAGTPQPSTPPRTGSAEESRP